MAAINSGRKATPLVSPDKPLLEVKDITELLGVSPNTVYRWIARGELEAVDLGNVAGKRVTPDALNRFLRSRRVKAVA